VALAIKDVPRPHLEEKMALRAAVLRRRLSRAKYDTVSSFIWFINNIFWQKQQKNLSFQKNHRTLYFFRGMQAA